MILKDGRKGVLMAHIPTRDEAWELLKEYNRDDFHLRHACIVEGVMRYFARTYDPEREEFWGIVGLLHDIDFERYPEQHCVKGVGLLRERGVDESIVHATMSHGFGIAQQEFEPTHIMEKILFATDELTGLIGAVAVMRPSKSVQDLELKSVKKKFKQLSFAAGCSREVIQQGADMLNWQLDDLIMQTIHAMRTLDCVD
jgi:predicted hydrolase (HD superfamily)